MDQIEPQLHAITLQEAFLWHETILPAYIELGDRLGGKIHITVYSKFPGVVIPDTAARMKTMLNFPDADQAQEIETTVLNIRSGAVENRALVHDSEGRLGLSFTAGFNGVRHKVFVPAAAIAGIEYPDNPTPPARIPTAPLFDWLFIHQIYGKKEVPQVVAVEGNVRPIDAPPRGRPLLTVVK